MIMPRGYNLSDEGREAIREARRRHPNPMQGRRHSEETRREMSRTRTGVCGKYFWGGTVAEAFAKVLCPVGFERERHIFLDGHRISMDFVHMTGKVDIELDGPYHYGHALGDVERDRLMKADGWMIIRIEHDGDL